jgi:hypothetical protein
MLMIADPRPMHVQAKLFCSVSDPSRTKMQDVHECK